MHCMYNMIKWLYYVDCLNIVKNTYVYKYII